MNKSSIFFSITLAFVALFILIIISFGVLYTGSQKRDEQQSFKRSFDIAHSIKNELRSHKSITPEFKEYLEVMGFEFVAEKDNILAKTNKKIIWKKERKEQLLRSFELEQKNYLHMQNHKTDILLLDKNQSDDFRVILVVVFLALLVAFALLYLSIIQKLKPLKTLKESVKNIGKEEFDTLCATNNKDEISELANEFDRSAQKLKALKESRNVFIRNIMHELKTPIAKGQFLVQLPNTPKNQESMQKVFYRLESLINEFASIEELIASKNPAKIKEYSLCDIIDNASDLLMSSQKCIHREFEDIRVNVDFKLFSIAVKNLMDNAIKYSSDKKVTIKTEGNFIVFQNLAEPLKRPLQEYFEAFSTKQNATSSQSFGLGLYIVKHILDANKLTLRYEHSKGTNRFIIEQHS